jgi:hypothetical protein
MYKKSNLNRRSPARKAPALSYDELMLQPWFLTARVQRRITGLVPPSYRQKMRDFYDDYGCMICGGSDGNHYANGMCIVCNGSVRRRLLSSATRRLSATVPRRVDMKLVSKARLARRMLMEFRSKSVSGARNRSSLASLQNPVDLVIGGHVR